MTPVLTVIAGPNGSGKTTLTSLVREAFQDVPILDPDALAQFATGISPNSSSQIQAGKETLTRAKAMLDAKQSFVAETTLSGNTYLHLMKQAKALGYRVVLLFVGTEAVEINIDRVKQRVLFGGHDVPEEDQRRRFPRAFANLRKALQLVDQVSLYDNSETAHRLFLTRDSDGTIEFPPRPAWAADLAISEAK